MDVESPAGTAAELRPAVRAAPVSGQGARDRPDPAGRTGRGGTGCRSLVALRLVRQPDCARLLPCVRVSDGGDQRVRLRGPEPTRRRSWSSCPPRGQQGDDPWAGSGSSGRQGNRGPQREPRQPRSRSSIGLARNEAPQLLAPPRRPGRRLSRRVDEVDPEFDSPSEHSVAMVVLRRRRDFGRRTFIVWHLIRPRNLTPRPTASNSEEPTPSANWQTKWQGQISSCQLVYFAQLRLYTSSMKIRLFSPFYAAAPPSRPYPQQFAYGPNTPAISTIGSTASQNATRPSNIGTALPDQVQWLGSS